MSKVFISTTTFAKFSNLPIKLLTDNNFRIMVNPFGRKLRSEEIIELAANTDGIIAGTEIYTKNALDKLTNLKVISRIGVGIDNIDLEAVAQKGIKVYKTQTTPAKPVAELALGLIIDVARKISKANYNLKNGHWMKEMGYLLQGKTLGIIGLGNIGKALVKLVKGFQFNICAYDIYPDEEFSKKNHITYCDLNSLLAKSDIVSIHLNLTKKTYNLINADGLSRMKSDAILINTSRGEIINESALSETLKSNKIAGAGLDVYSNEPYLGPLTESENAVLTPHIGAYAKEIRVQMEIEATENLIKGLE